MTPNGLRDVRFEHTRIAFAEGEPIDHPREAMFAGVNARGVMASGLAGALRIAAGPDVERELRSLGVLLVGSAYVTGPGMLAPRGVERLIFGITTARPGQSPTRAAVEQALGDALDVAGRARTRALTLPEVGTRIPGIELAEAGTLLATELAGHLRRSSGLDEVVIAGLHRAYLRACRDALISRGAWVGS